MPDRATRLYRLTERLYPRVVAALDAGDTARAARLDRRFAALVAALDAACRDRDED